MLAGLRCAVDDDDCRFLLASSAYSPLLSTAIASVHFELPLSLSLSMPMLTSAASPASPRARRSSFQLDFAVTSGADRRYRRAESMRIFIRSRRMMLRRAIAMVLITAMTLSFLRRWLLITGRAASFHLAKATDITMISPRRCD